MTETTPATRPQDRSDGWKLRAVQVGAALISTAANIAGLILELCRP